MSQKPTDALTYRDAGVDIDAGNELVERIKGAVGRTRRPEVMGGIGGFGGLFEMPAGYQQPVLVSGTDGVGTKLKLAMDYDQHDGIGIDLVAMCVNDIIVTGAEPLFFLDYYATGKLDVDVASRVVASIADGCELAGCSLVGGETAEMPGMYHGGDYDLAGFSVGVVEKADIIDGSKVAAGDVLIGLPASGPHSNGYSLIRKVLEVSDADVREPLAGKPLIEHLLAPTTIYVKALQKLMAELPVHALAHITGGGLPENLPRVLPDNASAIIDSNSWQRPAIFTWLQEQGNIPADDMWRTFNCGVGMVIVVSAENADKALATLQQQDLAAWKIGSIEATSGDATVTIR